MRVGRCPVASESDSTCSGAVRYWVSFHAASTRASPLSITTQASGPAMVSWLPPGNDGITCTP